MQKSVPKWRLLSRSLELWISVVFSSGLTGGLDLAAGFAFLFYFNNSLFRRIFPNENGTGLHAAFYGKNFHTCILLASL